VSCVVCSEAAGRIGLPISALPTSENASPVTAPAFSRGRRLLSGTIVPVVHQQISNEIRFPGVASPETTRQTHTPPDTIRPGTTRNADRLPREGIRAWFGPVNGLAQRSGRFLRGTPGRRSLPVALQFHISRREIPRTRQGPDLPVEFRPDTVHPIRRSRCRSALQFARSCEGSYSQRSGSVQSPSKVRQSGTCN
jgi:hypothetical protein